MTLVGGDLWGPHGGNCCVSQTENSGHSRVETLGAFRVGNYACKTVISRTYGAVLGRLVMWRPYWPLIDEPLGAEGGEGWRFLAEMGLGIKPQSQQEDLSKWFCWSTFDLLVLSMTTSSC